MDPISTTLGIIGTYDLIRTTAGKLREDAPKVAATARGLWGKVAKSSGDNPSSDSGADAIKNASNSADPNSGNNSIAELQNQVRASLEIANTLAEQSIRFADFVEATRQQFETIEKQNRQLVERVNSDRMALKALENQSSLLFQRVESDSALMKSLEAQNLKLIRDIERAQSRIGRLTGICAVTGLISVVGLAIAIAR